MDGYKLTKECSEYSIYKSLCVKYQWLISYRNKVLLFSGKYGLKEFESLRLAIENTPAFLSRTIENTLNKYLSKK